MVLLLSLTAITFLIFFTSYLKDSRKLINGFLFNIFLFSAMITTVDIAFETQNRFLILLFLVFFIIMFIVFAFGIYALIVGLFINAKVVIKRESRTPANLLTFFLAIALILYLIWSFAISSWNFPEEVKVLLGGINFILLYYLFDVFNFLMISSLYQFNKPKLCQDFIIVLGSGLIGERVPPLLASRIDKAIEFYNKQGTVTNPPKIIFSGGQGSDEKISEALAMQRYATQKGIPIEDTILEDKSVNTLQNMIFSKKIMDNLIPNTHASVFVTNNFHLFRAGIFARKAGLKSQGIGSKTAFYFLPNAMIREYIAFVVMYKKRHVVITSLILIMSILLSIVQYFFVTPYL
ncbi:YdcF family protein [Clostridium botulinum]|uniref:YdcF family protein n=1 Tax=Clostridium botulinum TaxID=1491 RepID=UPI0014510117|nr:YdcF family protein [Clostridium botulinum]MBY6811461.1 YdcF family protein [Clostridium botulinum]MBY6824929.1 YdcF family protein [Clostridium botulinum]MBY6835274.1 YdcF family protein [Clostridium botulinum]MBY6973797.1 YdcF family protein [Clostridium botulinum]NFO03640.1 YdcF family protein [Clostridium botulinum]